MNGRRGRAAPAGVSSAHLHSCLQHVAAAAGGDRIRPLPSCHRRDHTTCLIPGKANPTPAPETSPPAAWRGLIRPRVPALLSSHGGTWRRPQPTRCRITADNRAGASITPHPPGLRCASRGPAACRHHPKGPSGLLPPSREPPGQRPLGTDPRGGPHSQQCQCQVLP